jgi:hypothetical protein
MATMAVGIVPVMGYGEACVAFSEPAVGSSKKPETELPRWLAV